MPAYIGIKSIDISGELVSLYLFQFTKPHQLSNKYNRLTQFSSNVNLVLNLSKLLQNIQVLHLCLLKKKKLYVLSLPLIEKNNSQFVESTCQYLILFMLLFR